MMTTLYGVYKWEGIRKVLKAAFADEADAQEMLMDLFFEYSFEVFCYLMKQEDVYWYCGGEKWRGIKSEVEAALECARDPLYFFLYQYLRYAIQTHSYLEVKLYN